MPLISSSDSQLFIPCGLGDSELYIGCLGDAQGISSFWGQDEAEITVELLLPVDGTQDTDGVIRFIFKPTSSNAISSCSLIYQDGIYTTINSIVNGESNVIEVVGVEFGHPLFRDNLRWSVNCTDSFGNVGASGIRELDAREDAVGDPGVGGGGITPVRNPIRMDLSYPELWGRGSEVELIMKIYNKENELYEPPEINISFNIEGVELESSEIDELSQIIKTFEISKDADLGNKEITQLA